MDDTAAELVKTLHQIILVKDVRDIDTCILQLFLDLSSPHLLDILQTSSASMAGQVRCESGSRGCEHPSAKSAKSRNGEELQQPAPWARDLVRAHAAHDSSRTFQMSKKAVMTRAVNGIWFDLLGFASLCGEFVRVEKTWRQSDKEDDAHANVACGSSAISP